MSSSKSPSTIVNVPQEVETNNPCCGTLRFRPSRVCIARTGEIMVVIGLIIAGIGGILIYADHIQSTNNNSENGIQDTKTLSLHPTRPEDLGSIILIAAGGFTFFAGLLIRLFSISPSGSLADPTSKRYRVHHQRENVDGNPGNPVGEMVRTSRQKNPSTKQIKSFFVKMTGAAV